jgi:hypothetical protein
VLVFIKKNGQAFAKAITDAGYPTKVAA